MKMDFLYQLCCIPKEHSVDINDLKGSNFNQFLDTSLKSAGSINRNQTLKQEATDEFVKLLSKKSNSPSNTVRTINSLFESAIAANKKDRDLLEWLQVLVNTTVKYGLDPTSIKTPTPMSEKPLPSPTKQSPKKSTGKKTTSSSSDDTDVSWEEDDGDRYEYIGSSDDDYTPSDGDDAVVPGKKHTTRKSSPSKKPIRRKKKLQDQTVPDSPPKSPNKKEATIPVIKEGAGPKALTKYFLDMDTTSIKSSKAAAALPQGFYARSFFFPSKDSFNAFLSALNSATKTIDICVFAFTDDDVADALIAAKKRGVNIKIITDNQQAAGKGADAKRLQESYGIPFKTDKTTGYMHNKFAIIDSSTLINGSFNWSKGARFKNRENVIITNIPIIIAEFQAQFDSLWEEF